MMRRFGVSVPARGRAEASDSERTNRRSVAYTIFVPSGEIDTDRARVPSRPSTAIEKRMTGAGRGASRRSIHVAATPSATLTIIADVTTAVLRQRAERARSG